MGRTSSNQQHSIDALKRRRHQTHLSERGFSMTEVMMAVGIICVLASIAAPNFQHFRNLAKQSEAKSNLAALYTAEKAFENNWGGYTGDFRDLGISFTGRLNYDVGFSARGWVPPPSSNFMESSSAGCSAGVAYNTEVSACAMDSGASQATASFAEAPAGNGCGGGAPPSGSEFRASAVGGPGGNDAWTMDQNKKLCNNVAGGSGSGVFVPGP